MSGTPGLFFYLPSWRDWDQMVYDDLFHVWQLLLTIGWVIYLQQAGGPSSESSKRKCRSQCASAFQACACIAFADVLRPKEVTWPRPDQVHVDGDCARLCVPGGMAYWGPLCINPPTTWDQGPECLLIMSLPFSAGHLHSFTQNTCPYLESRDPFFSFPPKGNRCFLFNCILKITGKNFDWPAVGQMQALGLSNWDMIMVVPNGASYLARGCRRGNCNRHDSKSELRSLLE